MARGSDRISRSAGQAQLGQIVSEHAIDVIEVLINARQQTFAMRERKLVSGVDRLTAGRIFRLAESSFSARAQLHRRRRFRGIRGQTFPSFTRQII